MLSNLGWLDRNSQRNYPLDDASSGLGDDGSRLPSDFLVEARLWLPEIDLGPGRVVKYIHLSSAAVSTGFTSLTLLGCADPLTPANGVTSASAEDFLPLAVLTVTQPVVPFRNYAVEPLYTGVRGWVAFGEAVLHKRFSILFNTPQQAALLPRCVNTFASAPVTGIRSRNGFSVLTGDITVDALSPLQAEIRSLTLDGESSPRDMLVLSLENTEEALSQYAGPCGIRPEAGTCNKIPISTIGGISPSCDGDVTIVFDDITIRSMTNPEYPAAGEPALRGGICLDTDYEVDDICAETNGLPDEYGNLPRDVSWERPCDLTVPFTADFSTTEVLLDTMTPQSGYFFIDDSTLYGAAGYGTAEMVACLHPVSDEGDSRTFEAKFSDLSEDGYYGLVLFDMPNTKLLFFARSADDWQLIQVDKSTETETVLIDGTETLTQSVSVTVNEDRTIDLYVDGGVPVATYTFADDDVYYDNNGRFGIAVRGVTATITSFTVN